MVNLIKLCVGIKSVEHLLEIRQSRRELGQGHSYEFDIHRTRMMPKRRDEIIGKGSIYWVIAGKIQCRQKIVDLDMQIDSEGKKCCDIIMDKEVIRTIMQPKQPFQGWRYFDQEDAPLDLGNNFSVKNAKLLSELAQLGLL